MPIRRTRTALLVAASAVLSCGAAAAVIVGQHGSGLPVPTDATRTQASSHATRSLDLGDATIRIPAGWYEQPFRGAPATVYFPLVFLSSARLTAPCAVATHQPTSCESQNWFPVGIRTPIDGLVVMWGQSEFPGSFDRLAFAPGAARRIAHRPGRLYAGADTDSKCPPGAHAKIVATVRDSTESFTGGQLHDMVACLGARASVLDRQAVYAMVRSLAFKRR